MIPAQSTDTFIPNSSCDAGKFFLPKSLPYPVFKPRVPFVYIVLFLLLGLPTSVAVAEDPGLTKFTSSKLSARIKGPSPSSSIPEQHKEQAFRLNEEGIRLIFQGEREAGVKKIRLALELDPSNPTVLYNMAGIHLTEGNSDSAIEAMIKAIKAEPNDLAFINRLAESYFAASNVENAVKTYERLTELDPSYEQALLRLGSLYGMQQRWEEAEKALKEAHKLKPSDPQVLNNLGTTLIVQQKFIEAIELLKKANQHERSADTTLSIGIAYDSIDNKAEALKYFREAKKLGAKDPELDQKILDLERN